MTSTPTVVSLPVAFHRWFEDGAGWGCDDSIMERLPDLVRATRDLLVATDSKGAYHLKLGRDRLIVTREPDRNCPDKKAQARYPFILKCCLIAPETVERLDSHTNDWPLAVEQYLEALVLPEIRQDGGRFRIPVSEIEQLASSRSVNGHAESLPTVDPAILRRFTDLQKQLKLLFEELHNIRNAVQELKDEIRKQPAPAPPRPSLLRRLFWWRKSKKHDPPDSSVHPCH